MHFFARCPPSSATTLITAARSDGAIDAFVSLRNTRCNVTMTGCAPAADPSTVSRNREFRSENDQIALIAKYIAASAQFNAISTQFIVIYAKWLALYWAPPGFAQIRFCASHHPVQARHHLRTCVPVHFLEYWASSKRPPRLTGNQGNQGNQGNHPTPCLHEHL